MQGLPNRYVRRIQKSVNIPLAFVSGELLNSHTQLGPDRKALNPSVASIVPSEFFKNVPTTSPNRLELPKVTVHWNQWLLSSDCADWLEVEKMQTYGSYSI